MVQWVKPPLATLVPVLVGIPAALLLIHLLAYVPGKAGGDGTDAWDLDGGPGI